MDRVVYSVGFGWDCVDGDVAVVGGILNRNFYLACSFLSFLFFFMTLVFIGVAFLMDWSYGEAIPTEAIVLEKYAEETPFSVNYFINYEYHVLGKDDTAITYQKQDVSVYDDFYNDISVGSQIQILYSSDNPEMSKLSYEITQVEKGQVLFLLILLVSGCVFFMIGKRANA